MWHFLPSYPGGHKHLKVLLLSLHVAPFWHGPDKHGVTIDKIYIALPAPMENLNHFQTLPRFTGFLFLENFHFFWKICVQTFLRCNSNVFRDNVYI